MCVAHKSVGIKKLRLAFYISVFMSMHAIES